jgi:hypothetical protein
MRSGLATGSVREGPALCPVAPLAYPTPGRLVMLVEPGTNRGDVVARFGCKAPRTDLAGEPLGASVLDPHSALVLDANRCCENTLSYA